MTEVNEPVANQSPHSVDWSVCAMAVATVFAFALALCPNNVDSDLWGHVLYGQDVLRDGVLPKSATYTFTARGHTWINHENIAELALAAGIQFLGPTGMLTLKCLAGLAVIGWMLKHGLARGVQPMVGVAFLLVVAVSLTAFWALRPQVFSYVFLALMLVMLNRAFCRWRSDGVVQFVWLMPLPWLFVLWTNSHGAFVAGLCLLLAYLGGRSVEAFWWRRWGAWRTVCGLAGMGTLVVAATFVNPYGTDLWNWLLTTLSQPRPENSEWIPPSPSHEFYLPFVLLVVIFISAWCLSKRPRDWVHFLLVALCCWQSFSHLRHIALFAILVGFWVPEHLQSALDRFRTATAPGDSPRWQMWCTTAIFVVATLIMSVRLQSRLQAIEVRKDDYPVAALQFMREQDLHGKLVVSFSWAQYAIAALSPDVEVAFDGRFRTCYPQEVIDMHFDFQIGSAGGHRFRSSASGAVDGHRVLTHGKPDLILVDRRFGHGVHVMESQDEFTLLFQDALAQVWGRRDRFDNPGLKTYVPVESRMISDARQVGTVAWPAFPTRRP